MFLFFPQGKEAFEMVSEIQQFYKTLMWVKPLTLSCRHIGRFSYFAWGLWVTLSVDYSEITKMRIRCKCLIHFSVMPDLSDESGQGAEHADCKQLCVLTRCKYIFLTVKMNVLFFSPKN